MVENLASPLRRDDLVLITKGLAKLVGEGDLGRRGWPRQRGLTRGAQRRRTSQASICLSSQPRWLPFPGRSVCSFVERYEIDPREACALAK